jgi:hypothetical protein
VHDPQALEVEQRAAARLHLGADGLVEASELLLVICGGVVVLMFRIAAAGKPLHHDFAEKAASVFISVPMVWSKRANSRL